jgi:hypothetical protein
MTIIRDNAPETAMRPYLSLNGFGHGFGYRTRRNPMRTSGTGRDNSDQLNIADLRL